MSDTKRRVETDPSTERFTLRQSRRRNASMPNARLAMILAAAFVSLATSCAGARFAPEGLDIQTVPPNLRADYEVFADRCSRCHTLARPLNSGFTTMTQWRNYVARMRRQPGSGISLDDTVHILDFLAYFNDHRDSMRSPEARP